MIRPAPLHVDIASRAGTTRESMTRALGELARQGVIRRESDALVVLDIERLEELVEAVRGQSTSIPTAAKIKKLK